MVLVEGCSCWMWVVLVMLVGRYFVLRFSGLLQEEGWFEGISCRLFCVEACCLVAEYRLTWDY